jgi:hypothetical protein
MVNDDERAFDDAQAEVIARIDADVNLVNELLAERRDEAEREEGTIDPDQAGRAT